MAAALDPDPTPTPPPTATWEVTHDEAYFKTHVRRLRRCRCGWNLRFVFNLLALALMVWVNVMVFTSPREPFFPRLFLPAALVILVLSQWSQPWLATRRWRKSPVFGMQSRFTMNREGMRVTDPVSEGQIRWAAFTRARRFADGWLLFFGPSLAYWLPNAAVAAGTVLEADWLIRTYVPNCRNL